MTGTYLTGTYLCTQCNEYSRHNQPHRAVIYNPEIHAFREAEFMCYAPMVFCPDLEKQ